MGRPPHSLTPHASARHFLGAELRGWRQTRGLSTVELSRQIHVSAELVQKIERAERTAHRELIAACDHVLDTGGALGRLLAFITQAERPIAAEPVPSPRTEPVPSPRTEVVPLPPAEVLSRPTEVVIKVVTEVLMPSPQPASGSVRDGDARIYPFPVRVEAAPDNAST